jgi:nucleoside-diphosphate-sugar epimerase
VSPSLVAAADPARASVRVLVAGGCGFLGSHLVERLLKRHEISELVVVDNLWTGSVRNLAHLSDRRLKIIVADAESMSPNGDFDEIYHFASPATPKYYMADPVRTVSANVGGALNLLPRLRPGGQFAYASTSEVYGEAEVAPQPESYRGHVDCTGPRGSYDESKRCVEALLMGAHRSRGVRVKIARLFNVYGPRTSADDGRAVSNMIGQAVRGFPLTVYGDGAQSRCWGYVDDLMDGLERFFWADGVTFTGPLNLGSDREDSVLALARYVASLFPRASIALHPPVPQDPTSRRPDLTLARSILPGWTCRVPYEEGVRRTAEWFVEQEALESLAPIKA